MATNAELYVPTSPSTFNFRPLSTGMVTSETSMAMPNGSFLDVNGYDVTTRGPKKHGAWRPGMLDVLTGAPIQLTFTDPTERIEASPQLAMPDGTTIELVLTNRSLYLMDEALGYKRLNWMETHNVHMISQTATTTTVAALGDYRDNFVDTTDTLLFDSGEYTISVVEVTDVLLTITFNGVPSITGITQFNVIKFFKSNDEQFVDWISSRFKLYFVDGVTRMIWKFDGIPNGDGNCYMKPHIIKGYVGERTVMGAKSLASFGERLYFFGIFEDEVDSQLNHIYTTYWNRVRWTEVLDHSKCFSGSYQDLTRTHGRATKIVGMGSLIMAYMSDGIYYGRQTNLTSIPYVFTYIETAGITAIGMKAVSTYFDGQVFLGVDNLYFISADAQISDLGSAISETMRDSIEIDHMSFVAVDTRRSRILVGTSLTTTACDCVYLFNYRSKAWSRSNLVRFVAPSFLVNNVYLYYLSLPDTDLYNLSSLMFKSYSDVDANTSDKKFYCFMDGYLMQYEDTQGLNQLMVGGAVSTQENSTELITPDFDFDQPDGDKTALRVSLKITENNSISRTNNIYFEVWGSNNRGLSWKHLGRMRIQPNRDEDALNFRFMGSTLRFKFRHGFMDDGTSTDVEPFTISEVILRIRERSIEVQRDNSRT